MSTMSRPHWTTAVHNKTVSLAVYFISIAVLIAALALTLAVSISRGNTSGTGTGAGTRTTTPAVPDYCNLRAPGSYC